MELIKRYREKIYFLCLFFVLFIFFYIAHPLTIFDSDDWLYLYSERVAIPIIHGWNPGKVLPEFIMPLMAFLASYVVYPISGNFVDSLALVFGLLLCIVLLVYFYYAYRVLIYKTNIDKTKALFILTIFVIFHFLAYKIDDYNNEHVFYSNDVTCIFHYTIPTLLNFILVFYFILNDDLKDINSYSVLKKSVLLLLVYLAVFSCMFGSQVIAIYSTYILLKELIDYLKKKDVFIKRVIANYPHFLIIFMWFAFALFELTGERADVVGATLSYKTFISCLNRFIDKYTHLNRYVLIMLGISIILGIILCIKRNKNYIGLLIEILVIFILSSLYLLLLNTKLNGGYLRSDTYIVTSIIIFIFICFTLATFIKDYEKVFVLVPLIILVLFAEFNVRNDRIFKDSNQLGDSKLAKAIDNYIIESVDEAIKRGSDSLDLYLPKMNDGDNFPLAIYGGDRYAKALRKLNVTDKLIEVNVIVDENLSLEDIRYKLNVE